MVSRSLFLFPVYKRHFVFITVTIIYLCRTYVLWIGRPKNVGLAAGISQICYSYHKPFLFPVYKRHFVYFQQSLSICVGHTSCGLDTPENVGIAAGISQICYS